MANILDVANYFIQKSYIDQEDEVDITQLKLQKLLYYAQGVHLAKTNTELFSNDIIAWEHGPVIKDVWDKYKSHTSNKLPKPDISLEEIEKQFSKEELDSMKDVYSYFGQFSAWKLRNMTHQETPWLYTLNNQVISVEVIKKYFKENILA